MLSYNCIRMVRLFFQTLLIAHLFLINYRISYPTISKQILIIQQVSLMTFFFLLEKETITIKKVFVFRLVISSPLYLQFKNLTEEQQALENFRYAAWQSHFSIYGRGVTMYRTNELDELLFQGIPNALRNELWLVFSGAIYDVSSIQKIIFI